MSYGTEKTSSQKNVKMKFEGYRYGTNVLSLQRIVHLYRTGTVPYLFIKLQTKRIQIHVSLLYIFEQFISTNVHMYVNNSVNIMMMA